MLKPAAIVHAQTVTLDDVKKHAIMICDVKHKLTSTNKRVLGFTNLMSTIPTAVPVVYAPQNADVTATPEALSHFRYLTQNVIK